MSARRRFAALAALWAAVTGALVLAPACYTHNCDGQIDNFGRNAGEGHLVGPNTWESNPIDEPWLEFPAQQLYIFDLHELGNRPIIDVRPYVSANSDPFHQGQNFTQGAGNIAEISGATNGQVVIKNGTCAHYFLRLVVEAAPYPPQPTDGGAATADADALPAGDAAAAPDAADASTD
jgi:hypothetical protein